MEDGEYYTQPRPEMLPMLPSARRHILEIGCAEGLFLHSIVGAEEKWGVEPTQPAAAAASTRLTRVINKPFDEAKKELPLSYFDLVIYNDVIEHMTDHDSFLLEIRQYIAPGGVIVGSIPNARLFNAMR